jgi:thiol-disulfide isomerase/thioredoxin
MTDSASTTTTGDRVSAMLATAARARAGGQSDTARAELQSAIEIARSSPYDVSYEVWTRLLVDLVDVLVASNEIERARATMAQDAPFIGKINEIMQATGSPDQKRQAAGGWIKVRDRQTQLGLIGQRAPEIGPVTWALGEPTTLQEQLGRVVVLEFWATWCTPCVQAFSELDALHRELEPQGLSTIALTRLYSSAVQGPAEQAAELNTVKNFVAGRDLGFQVGTLSTDETHRQYGASGLPTVILIDRAGRVRSAHFGSQDFDFQRMLRACLSVLEA